MGAIGFEVQTNWVMQLCYYIVKEVQMFGMPAPSNMLTYVYVTLSP
jgi:hypothetical protein